MILAAPLDNMRTEEIVVGNHKAGVFTISIYLPVFTTSPGNYFDVHVTQKVHFTKELSFDFYVNLVNDARFSIFKHMSVFTRKLSEEDLVEYNSHINTLSQNLVMPSFKLSRHSIVALFEVCQRLSKKLDKSSFGLRAAGFTFEQ